MLPWDDVLSAHPINPSGSGGAWQLRRDDHAVYMRHHPALEVPAPRAATALPRLAARPRHTLAPQPGLLAAPRPGQRRARAHGAPAQRHHRVHVRVPEQREQERGRRQHDRGADQRRARRPGLPRRRARGGGARRRLRRRRPAAAAATPAQAGHPEAPRRRAQALVVPPRPVRLDAVARPGHDAGHGQARR
ncbi:hypothetical protein PVAP13_3NG180296 [Panicum virgatum]|uniref:Uncharacterized protein n=1 Tax=Panicum virgatum TaxID=38727 RepID=A0A8T0U343_PANVG|nr:hypothetical protein PVAP13_3NG180296 [Panicum virgatum]